MITWRLDVLILVVLVQTCVIYCQHPTKSSLTFVIDDSYSMTDEINQVKESVDSIFDTVMQSNESQIENFVLVTFNDPGYILHTVTNDRMTFKRAAARVHVRGGNPACPERAMLGIKIAIENSLPMSTLYVFTDASAKDYKKYDEIKAMAQRKQIQVTFMLTGKCGSRDRPDYQAYHQLARATSGEVFNLVKADIKDILKYVKENTKGRGDFIASKSFPPGYGYLLNFEIDSRTKDFVISIAGLRPTAEVIDPNGNIATTEPLVNKKEILITKVTNTIPGMYTVKLGSETNTLAKVTGKSDIHFEYGFTTFEPTSLSVTATRPEPDGKTYLSVQLHGNGVKFKTAKIVDLDDNVLNELSLRLVDNQTDFYVTEPFNPPEKTFRVLVFGYDEDNDNKTLQRSAASPTDVRNPEHEKPVNVAPQVTILEGSKVILDNGRLQVTCKVHAFPQPEIVWREKDTGISIPSDVRATAPPYDFMSILKIENLTKNCTYECIATSPDKTLEAKNSQIEVVVNTYFDVLETPKNITNIEYGKEGSILCKVNANPPATITWYKDGRVLSDSTNIVISSDKTTVTIKQMDLESEGKFTCEVRNELQTQEFHSNVVVFGLEEPVIEKIVDVIRVIKGGDIDLECSIIQATPKPTIRWYYQPHAGDNAQELNETSNILQLKHVTIDQNGNYTCNVTNEVGFDSFTIKLIVEYPPIIKGAVSSFNLKPELGDAVSIPCDVDGVPPPTVQWLKDSIRIDSTVDIDTTSNYSLNFRAITVSNTGSYTCKAENQYGSVNKTVFVDVVAKPIIAKTNKAIRVTKGEDALLECRFSQGAPKPTIKWYFQPQGSSPLRELGESGEVLQLKHVTIDHDGTYECNASNTVGSDNLTVELTVEYPPTINDDDDKTIRVEQGEAVTIPCDVDGVPPPTVKWLKDGSQVDSTVDVHINTNNSLTFPIIMVRDSGHFTCAANNTHGSRNKTVFVDVFAKPLIEKTNRAMRVTKGEDTQIKCRIIQGTPRPTIKWYFQPQGGGTLRELDETGEVLQLKHVTIDHDGTYECNASTTVGSDNFTVELTVEYPSTIIGDNNKTISAKQGDTVTISCDVDGVPPPTVKWLKDGTRVDSTVDVHINTNNSLTFPTIMVSNTGHYTCEAENKHGSSNKTVFVDVFVPPTITGDSPNMMKPEQGDAVIIPCDVNGVPPPTVKWLKDGSRVVSTVDIDITSKHSLKFRAITVSNTGYYTCEVESHYGSVNKTVFVDVTAKPMIEKTNKELQVTKGGDTELACRIIQGAPKPTIKWQFQPQGGGTLRELNETGEVLQLKHVTVDHDGTYKCNASNTVGSDSFTVELTVEYSSTIIGVDDKTISIKQGDAVTIPCDVDGVPPPTVKWLKDGTRLDSTVDVHINTNNSLTFPTIMVSNTGHYTCEAENKHGSSNKTVFVDVFVPPTITGDSPNMIKPEQGDAVTIPCDVNGVPPPTVKWLKDGSQVVSTVDIDITSKHSLKFRAITVSNTGYYTCEVESHYGSVNKTVFVDVTAKPMIEKTNKELQVTKGGDTELACRIIQGAPKPTIKWQFQPQGGGTLRELNETGEVLKLKHVTVDHDGTFECNASNTVGSDSFTVELTVEYSSTIIGVDDKTISIKQGDAVTIPCDVDGVPPPTVKWLKDGTRLDSTVDVHINTNNSLTFPTIMVSNTGHYTCEAENKHGSSNKTVFVDVFVPPTITGDSPNIIKPEQGDAVTIPCDVDGVPPPTVKWLKDGSRVVSTVDIDITSKHSLKFRAITVSNTGSYTCQVESKYGSVNKTVFVDVTAKPIIEKSNNKIQVTKEEDTQLECRIVQAAPKPTIHWYYQPQAGDDVQELSETSNILQLKHASVDRNGNYTCNVTNDVGSDSFTMELIVEYPPVINDDDNKTIRAEEGDAIIIPCHVDGVPLPTVKWFKDDTQLDNTTIIHITTNHSLTFDAVKVSDIGYYSCEAQNHLSSSKKTVIVDVFVPLQIETLTVTKIKRVLDQRLELKCLAFGHPPPHIEWIHKSFDGEIIPTNIRSRKNGQYLFAERIHLEDEGYYTCVASNIDGSVNITYEVKVNAKPVIRKVDYERREKIAVDVQLPCRIIQGAPAPTIQWYFQPQNSTYFVELNETNKNLQLKSVTVDDAGTYRCNASNVEGFDLQVVELIVEYPPTIKDDGPKAITAKHGDVVTISCDVDGVPSPSVKWLKNDVELHNTRDIHITRSHSLQFHAISVSSIENYTCVAENQYGSSNKTVSVDVYDLPKIEVPGSTTIEKIVGDFLMLPCRADGYPIPKFKWIYRNFRGEIVAKNLRFDKIAMFMGLPNITLEDSGYYVCVASNEGGETSLLYTVTVNAVPVIEDVCRDKTIKVVKGDLAIRIPCKVTGSPKPTVTWKKDGSNIAPGSAGYDIIENGTLIIKSTDTKSQGNYMCIAENKVGNYNVSYDVIVTDYPLLDKPASTLFIEEGKSVDITCDVPHTKFDLVRWYKDGNLLNEGEFAVNDAQQSDNGIYSCRVSNFESSSSAHVNVTVGSKPQFDSTEEEFINFVEGDSMLLDCTAVGEPTPKVSWWLNGEKIDATNMEYDLVMTLDNRGNYTCEVSNELGSIRRSFNIFAEGCILDIRKDFLRKNQPLMLSSLLTWPTFDVTNGYMRIKKDESFYLYCVKGFDEFNTQLVEAVCDNEILIINGNVYKYAGIKCKEETEPIVQINGRDCLPGYSTTSIQVGYDVDRTFMNVYDVCLDNDNRLPLYTRHVVTSAQYDATKNMDKWFGHTSLPLDFDTMYDCITQVEDISSTLGKPFHPHDHCCYNKRQLVNPKDLRPGIPPAVAYSYLNVVPHWSTCNSKNWADVEQKIRNLAKSMNNELIIWTGTGKPLSLDSRNIMIHDKYHRTQPVPQYLWKVVQDPVLKRSLAIIQVNVPDLRSLRDARKYVICKDICRRAGWDKDKSWHNVADGYTYCCSIQEFESAFNYRGQFSDDMTAILKNKLTAVHY